VRPRRRPKNADLGAIGVALDRVMATCDVPARFEVDPVSVVHRYPDLADRELVDKGHETE